MLSRLIVDYFEIINIKLNVSGGTTMKITVCIGSSCHIKGSRRVVEQLQYLIKSNHLSDEVELAGTFCMGKCQQGVCVTVDDEFHSVSPATVNSFFEQNVLAKLK